MDFKPGMSPRSSLLLIGAAALGLALVLAGCREGGVEGASKEWPAVGDSLWPLGDGSSWFNSMEAGAGPWPESRILAEVPGIPPVGSQGEPVFKWCPGETLQDPHPDGT